MEDVEASKNWIFAEIPDLASLILLTLGYSLLFLGIRLYGNTLYKVNLQKAEAETEIQLARKIHNAIISDINLDSLHFSAYGKIIPAREVGGDYIDLKQSRDQKAAMAIGDVTGHDVGSGLLMGMAKSAFNTELKYNDHIGQLMESLNETIYRHSRSDMFISFLSAFFDFKTKQALITNAGHFPLLVRRKNSGKIEQIKPAGLVLGVLQETKYEVETVTFGSGDIFIGFTDGIIEIRNDKNEEFGFDRLIAVINKADPDISAIGLYDHIMRKCNDFSPDTNLMDDQSLLVLKMK
jgi:sigma-B regulation protein RsbU (phosphoserine phosphatase)